MIGWPMAVTLIVLGLMAFMLVSIYISQKYEYKIKKVEAEIDD